MQGMVKTALTVGALLMGGVLNGQVQPIPEQQLANGFLGDRNDKLTSQGAPSNETYVAQATAAINQGQYRRALGILRPYRRSNELAYHYLAGRAYVGIGDYAAARAELTAATRKDRSFIGAPLALGLMEAEHGEEADALKILDDLKARQARCAGRCREASDLDIAVSAIEAAIHVRKH
ncbi:MAG: CDC27 family protein [Novosphingobium sp.]